MTELKSAENTFPTINDVHEVLSELIESGFGEMPVQILVVPDSTLQSLARHSGAKDDDKPALMMEFLQSKAADRHSVTDLGKVGILNNVGPTRATDH